MRLRNLLCLLSVLVWTQCSALFAQDQTRRIEEAMHRHFELMEQVIHHLEGQGQKEQAEQMRQQLELGRKNFATALERRRREPAERTEREEHDPTVEQERQEIDQRIHHLRVAAENLHAVGQHDQAEELLKQAARLEHELHGHQPPDARGHLEAMEQLESMRRELHAVREELEGLRAEVRLLRETLLRLPPPAVERHWNPPVIPAPERRSLPTPMPEDHPLQPSVKPSPPGGMGLFQSLDRNQDKVVNMEELGALKQAWAAAGIELAADEQLSPEAFQEKMEAFIDSRTQVRVSASTTHSNRNSPLVDSKLMRAKTEALFQLIDQDRNQKISAEEWDRSKTLKPRFEAAHIDLTEPMSKDDFIKHYLHLQEHADHSASDHAEPGK